MTGGNRVLARWNVLPADEAAKEILSCCGSTAWTRAMAAAGPFSDGQQVAAKAREIWRGLPEGDWMEAFRSHPRIGERHAERTTTEASARWSTGEQKSVSITSDEVKRAIVEGNRRYDDRFGRIFIICATGKQPEEILAALERRLANDDATEMKESATQQEEIMQLRLDKWLGPEEGA
jgi:2-oxo-4-hydroxy-4-carboxy-5-ureidoimidazoline decarboxylase